MKMTDVGQIGVLLETAPFREEIARGREIEIVIHRKDLKEDYHVLDSIQRQNIVTKKHAMVCTLRSFKTVKHY